jgi:polyribonucleotide nucleotidyltransferase
LLCFLRYLSEVIGKSGSSIKAIQDVYGVKLNVPQGVARDDTTNVKIAIAGPAEKVQEAKATIKEIAHYFYSGVTHPGVVHSELEDVPLSSYNLIIGPKGSEIRHIQNNFKVSVYIPNANSLCKNVLVVGIPQSVESASNYIRKIVNQSTKDEVALSEAFMTSDDAAPHEAWMDQYVHPSSRENQDSEATSASGPALSAWGSAVAYAEGW